MPLLKPLKRRRSNLKPGNEVEYRGTTSAALTNALCNVDEDSDDDFAVSFDVKYWSKLLLYASLWSILYGMALYAEFGAVYFLVSTLFIIWNNLRTGPKQPGELSAYSVFNPNCRRIQGTLDADQLENEIRSGMIF